MKIVFFTNKCSLGTELLRQIKNNNIPLEAIFIEAPKPQGNIKKVKRALKRTGFIETIKIIFKRLIKILSPRTVHEWLNNDFYYSYSKEVHIVDNFNGKQCEKLLTQVEPDIIVLGGSRIIRENIIKIPKIGILNAHPGLLPEYRGVDVIPWAIYNGDVLGITVHFIDEGIDTGGIIAKKSIDMAKNDTISCLRKKAEVVAGELMAETILRILENKEVQITPQSRGDGRQYYKMPENLLQETEIKLRIMINEHTLNKV